MRSPPYQQSVLPGVSSAARYCYRLLGVDGSLSPTSSQCRLKPRSLLGREPETMTGYRNGSAPATWGLRSLARCMVVPVMRAMTEHAGLSGVRAQQRGEHPDGGGLASAVVGPNFFIRFSTGMTDSMPPSLGPPPDIRVLTVR